MKRIGLVMIGFIVYSQLYSQIINVDKTDTLSYVHKAKWEGNFSEGMEVDKQNTTLFDATTSADFSMSKWRNLFILSGSERFTFSGPQDFLNTGYIHFRYRYNYKNQFHPEALAQYQWDDKIGMKYRFVTGANFRYNFWHKKKWEFTVGTGVIFETEKWDWEGVDTSKIPANASNVYVERIKSNNYVKWEGNLASNISLTTAVFYQACYDNFMQPRIAESISLDAAVTSHFAFGFKFYGMYDAKPIVPITHYYWSFSNSISYKL